MDVLAQRKDSGRIEGSILVDGKPQSISFQRTTGYCEQNDIHESTGTVRESLLFSARLRQEFEVPDNEKVEYVEKIMDLLELTASPAGTPLLACLSKQVPRARYTSRCYVSPLQPTPPFTVICTNVGPPVYEYLYTAIGQAIAAYSPNEYFAFLANPIVIGTIPFQNHPTHHTNAKNRRRPHQLLRLSGALLPDPTLLALLDLLPRPRTCPKRKTPTAEKNCNKKKPNTDRTT